LQDIETEKTAIGNKNKTSPQKSRSNYEGEVSKMKLCRFVKINICGRKFFCHKYEYPEPLCDHQ